MYKAVHSIVNRVMIGQISLSQRSSGGQLKVKTHTMNKSHVLHNRRQVRARHGPINSISSFSRSMCGVPPMRVASPSIRVLEHIYVFMYF